MRKKLLSSAFSEQNKESNLHRKTPFLSTKKYLLIVTEGENTEPTYFEKFKNPIVQVVAVGKGDHTCSLLKSVSQIQKENESKLPDGIKFDEVWVVFDKDDFSDFDSAVRLAKQKGYKVAYSNQAFEYWILLHFNDHQGGKMPRSLYADKINTELSLLKVKPYDKKSKKITDEIFDVLMGRGKNGKFRCIEAYNRAERLIKDKVDEKPSKQESITYVGKLVKTIVGDSDWERMKNGL